MWSIISNVFKLQNGTNAESDAPNPDMCAQFGVDLNAHNELIQALTARLQAVEKDSEERKNVIRSWKQKALYMEKLVRYLEEDDECERHKTAERDARQAARDDELRQMHHHVSQLDQETNDVKDERDTVTHVLEKAKEEMTMLRRELALRDGARKGETETERKKDVEWENIQNELARLRSELSLKDEQLATQDEEFTRKLESKDMEMVMKDEAVLQVDREKRELEMKLDNIMAERDKGDNFELELDRIITEPDKRDQTKLELDRVKIELDRITTERDNISLDNSQLRARIQRLQRDNASMEVTLAQRNKQIQHLKDDIMGLNIALDSKQQEVELIKRRYEVRRIAGPTPSRTIAAPPTTSLPPAKNRRRLLSIQSDAEKENMKH